MTDVPSKWANAAQSLKYDMLVSLGTGNVINLSSPTHSALTLALRDIAYDPHIEQGESLKITYRDLSRPRPFPVGTLSSNSLDSSLSNAPALVLGMLSHRHPEMDFLVDVYINTNREMSEAISMAEEDEVSYHNARYWFENVTRAEPLVAYVLHSGLEPMIVGFYRALTEALRPGSPQSKSILIIPTVFNPNLFPSSTLPRQSSDRLTEDSPGAKLEHYLQLPAWY